VSGETPQARPHRSIVNIDGRYCIYERDGSFRYVSDETADEFLRAARDSRAKTTEVTRLDVNFLPAQLDRIERKLDALLKALAEDEDRLPTESLDGEQVPKPGQESRSL
jgi:hypothetical protein